MSDLKKIKDDFLLKLEKKLSLSEINEIKTNLFGKNGLAIYNHNQKKLLNR